MIKVAAIYVYPVKSLAGIDVKKARVEPRGLQWDRRWMLVDVNGQFLSQRTLPILGGLQPELTENHLVIHDLKNGKESLTIPLLTSTKESAKVVIWDDTVNAVTVSEEADKWFSDYLGQPCRLVFMDEAAKRKTDPRYALSTQDEVSFADGYPLLMLSESALDLLNSKCPEPMQVARFRPNVLLSGCKPHEEDEWRDIQIGSVDFTGVKPCARCVMTTIHPKTLVKSAEPLATLTGYRKRGNKIFFGENFIPHQSGMIQVGDEVVVNTRKAAFQNLQ